MSLAPGTRIGPYEVTSILGTGGMGEVYRARDARLDRSVALKILPPDVAGDADRLQRFKREAHVLASLNHPNIAAIYGLEEGRAAGTGAPVDALVLELVEGPTLAERIAAGPLALDQARDIGVQIAAALEAAHERGIVHRDLKPANVKVRPDGTVKVLDFGLAKAWDPSAEPADVASSPTFTSPAMTRAGLILGTAAYMSPEQARGAPVDKRSDVWAFGCVLFEMLAGRHVFGGADTVSDAIAAVLKSEPRWDTLPPDTPPQIRSLLKRCLEKDPKRRLRDIGDAGLLLAESAQGDAPAAVTPRRSWIASAGWALALLLAIANVVWFARGFSSRSPSAPAVPLRLEVPLASDLVAQIPTRTFDISHDGQLVVYAGREGTGSSLHLQNLATGEIRRLTETADPEAPAFSPDGRFIGFRSGSQLKVLPLDSGLPRDLLRWDATFKAWAWGNPENIIVAGSAGLTRVPLDGGSPEVIVKLPEGEALFTSAAALPGGGYLVSMQGTTVRDEGSRVAVAMPGESAPRVLVERGGSPTYVPNGTDDVGHLVYAQAGRLFAVPFDPRTRTLQGKPVPVLDGVAMRPNGALADYGVTSSGTLFFREGSQQELVWVDRDTGKVEPLSAHRRPFALPRFSPDGKRLGVEIQESPHQIWILDVERDVLTPLTVEPAGSHNFAWTADGSAMVYSLGDLTPPQIGWIRTDGSGRSEKIVVAAKDRVMVESLTRDGRLAMVAMGSGSPPAVMIARLKDGVPPTVEGVPTKLAAGSPGPFSPDGAWLAYCDCGVTDDGPSNVFIRHLESGANYQVSTGNGYQPLWAPSGRELFFRSGSKMMAADLTFTGASVRVGRARTLFEGDYLDWGTANYDVSLDGKRFVMVRTANARSRTLSVRLNWGSELERLAPSKR